MLYILEMSQKEAKFYSMFISKIYSFNIAIKHARQEKVPYLFTFI